MTPVSSRFSTVVHGAPRVRDSGAGELAARLAALYERSQSSPYVFASPLGPFHHRRRAFHLPRFVSFGPHTHDESLRLAVLAGFDASDLRIAAAVLIFIERLVSQPELAQGLNLSFFPLIDVLGHDLGIESRDLARQPWGRRSPAELALLEKDARARGYHGFLRLEPGPGYTALEVRLRQPYAASGTPTEVELVRRDDFEAWPIHWEQTSLADGRVADGPLSVSDDLPVRAYELTLRVPQAWSDEAVHEAVPQLLRLYTQRQAALQAYRQNL